MSDFADKLLRWFDRHGRKDLPWQRNRTPYRVWVSEIMLQQTQVSTVIPYFQRFIESFPTVNALADADQDRVLHHWTGLGYYARARNLHRAAQLVVAEHGGEFPATVDALCQLPGIGRSTAGAIVSLGHGRRAAILDGNVKRVLSRCFAIDGWPEQSAVRTTLWELAESLTPRRRVAAYTQAIMDLGATVCLRSRPACGRCPLAEQCLARSNDSIARYPGRKPARALPVKDTFMHMIHNPQNQVLLEKRPPSGIWGGLWSFPESPSADRHPALAGCPLPAGESEHWPVLRHTFSHYHLDITPVHVKIQAAPDSTMESGRWLWYPLDQPAEVGLAAPVRRLLQQLKDLALDSH